MKNKKIMIYFIITFFFLVVFHFGVTNSYAITTYDLSDIESNWDTQNMDSQRIDLIKKGASLIGKTDHYNGRTYTLVKDPPYLSCSGFVSWCFKYSSTKWNQWQSTDKFMSSTKFKTIDKSELIPGDIVITKSASDRHMGIYAGKDSNGNLVWLHCTLHYGGSNSDIGKKRGVILSTETRFEKAQECVYRRYKKFDDSQGSQSNSSTNDESTGMGAKFVQIYNSHEAIQRNLEPEWLFESLNENVETVKYVDLTKYLLYIANNKRNKYNFGITKASQIYKEYEDNKFKTVDSKLQGGVGWEFTKSWENNDLRKYMNDDGVDYDSSTNIYSSVTEDRKQYIMHDKVSLGNGNKYFGFVHFYNTKWWGWQNTDLWLAQGINIQESEYNVYSESKIDVETVDKVGISIWEKYYKNIDNIAKAKKVDLEDYQYDCLVDILYEGYTPDNIQNIMEAFKNNGLKKDKITSACKDAFEGARGEARWELFSSGTYKTPIDGEELDPTDYNKGSGSGVASGLAEEIIETAKSKLGCPYLWGAHGPDSFDCTGFVEWVFKQHGIQAPWYTEAYYSYTQYEVSWEDMQPGDVLMCYNAEGGGHAGIFIGENQFIHAPRTRRCCKNYLTFRIFKI